MTSGDNSFDKLLKKLVKGKDDIKDYHFMVEQFDAIGSDCYGFEAEDGVDSDEKWQRIADMFKGFGYNSKRFSATKCRGRFNEWSAFYARNYDILNEKLNPSQQEIFDLLKIVHILDLTKLWTFTNRTHTLLRGIKDKKEIKEFLLAHQLNKIKLNDETRDHLRNQFNDDSNRRVPTFEGMNLSDDILRGLRELKYLKPSSIQQDTIVPFIKGRDVIAQAQSGTGKTAAFATAILQRIDTSFKETQALVLAPTRELAQQIHKELKAIGRYTRVTCHISIGGTLTREDANHLYSGYHVVVGTPGRVLHMMKEKYLRTHLIKMFILDESDQLLDLYGKFVQRRKGFRNQIFDVFRELKPSVQVFLSSATMPPEILQMSRSFTKNPVTILVKDEELTLEGLQQYYVNVGEESFKFDAFLDIFTRIRSNSNFEMSKTQAFVYCNKKQSVDRLTNMLELNDIVVAAMHGDTEQRDRQYTLNDFRQGYSPVLITTDLLGRGIDVKEVELVINYDLPENRETYIHRVGRSGRFGRTGKAINFITDAQKKNLEEIYEFYNTHIQELPEDFSQLF